MHRHNYNLKYINAMKYLHDLLHIHTLFESYGVSWNKGPCATSIHYRCMNFIRIVWLL